MRMDPEQERARLTALYANMPRAQLQTIAADPMSLTEIARAAVQVELRRRGISDADFENLSISTSAENADNQPDTSTVEDAAETSPCVVVRRFRDLQEALLSQGALESAEIQSFLADENMVRMDWMWSNAIGGMKLVVRDEDALEAARVLDQPIPEHIDIPDVGHCEQPTCPRCGSLDVSFNGLHKNIAYGSVFFGIPVPFHRRGWKCESCGNSWSGTGGEN